MLFTIRDLKGQGNSAIYVRIRSPQSEYWNFVSEAWARTESGECRVFLTEVPDLDLAESRYTKSTRAPSGTIVVEYVRFSDFLVLGEEEIEVPPTPSLAVLSGAGTNIPAPPDQHMDEAVVPSAEIELNHFVNQVRSFMRDYAELNRLISGEESSNRQIMWAILDALDDFNTTPPFSHHTIFSFPSRSLLLRATVISLLESVGLLQTRNHLQFSDGGIQVGVNDKTPFIQSWLQLFKNSYEEKKLKLKVSYNIESAWGGGVHSEYRFVNNFYGEW